MTQLDQSKKILFEREFKSIQQNYSNDLQLYYKLEQELGYTLCKEHGAEGVDFWLRLKLGQYWDGKIERHVEDTSDDHIKRSSDHILDGHNLIQFSNLELISKEISDQFISACTAVYSLKSNDTRGLLYFLDFSDKNSSTLFKLVFGGIPLSKVDLRDPPLNELMFSVCLSFLKIHNGFGPLQNAHYYWISDCILPIERWERLNHGNHSNLMMISPDPLGNGYCIDLNTLSDDLPMLVFYEHEGSHLSQSITCKSFYNLFFMSLLAAE